MRTPSPLRRSLAGLVTTALVAMAALVGLVAPAGASVATTTDPDAPAAAAVPAVTVSEAPRAGGAVTVTGTGFTPAAPGIYLGYGPASAPGFYQGGSEGTVWIAVGNEEGTSAAGRTAPMAEDGSFSITLEVPAYVEGNPLAVFTSKAHGQGFTDPSQNTVTPISYAAPEPTVTSATLALSATEVTEGSDVTATVTITPAEAAGTVQLTRDGAAEGSAVPVTEGTAEVTLTGLAAGSYAIGATFTPADEAAFTPATAAEVTLAVTATTPEPVWTPQLEVFLNDSTTAYAGEPVYDGDTLTVRGSGFDPEANVGGRGVPIPADLPQGSYVVLGSFLSDWQPSTGAPAAARKVVDQRWALTDATYAGIPERYLSAIAPQRIVLTPEGTFTTTLTAQQLTEAFPEGHWGVYTYAAGGVTNAEQELSVLVDYRGERPAEPEPEPEPEPEIEPQVTVTPADPLDPAVENVLTVSGTGFTGPGAANGVYVAIGVDTLWTGTGPFPADGWITVGYVPRLTDGAWTTTLTIPAGTLDPDQSYQVVTSAAHALSATDRSLDTFTPVAVAAPVTPPATCAATLTWGVKESFRNYVTGPIASGTITVAGGVEQGADNGYFRWSGEPTTFDAATGTGAVAYTGSVTFTGHGGVLDLTLSDPVLQIDSATSGRLYLDVTGTDATGQDVSGTDVLVATLTFTVSGTDTLTITDAVATLDAAGLSAFAGFYEAGAVLDPLSATIPVVATGDCATPPPPGGGGDGGTTPPPAEGGEDDGAAPGGSTGGTTTTPGSAQDKQCVPRPADTVIPGSTGSATLTWSVKESFRNYVTGPVANGSVSGGSTFSGNPGSISVTNRTGTASFGGSVSFTGHDGQLATTLSNPRIQIHSASSATLYLNVSAAGFNGSPGLSANGVAFATVSLPSPSATADSLTWRNAAVTLTAEGAKAFGGFYSAGQALDPLTLTVRPSVASQTVAADLPTLGAGEVWCDPIASTGVEGTQAMGLGVVGALLLGTLALVVRRRTMATS